MADHARLRGNSAERATRPATRIALDRRLRRGPEGRWLSSWIAWVRRGSRYAAAAAQSQPDDVIKSRNCTGKRPPYQLRPDCRRAGVRPIPSSEYGSVKKKGVPLARPKTDVQINTRVKQ